MKTALITGITGQAGAYLSRNLLEHGLSVIGTTRDIRVSHLDGLKYVDSADAVKLYTLKLEDFRAVLDLIDELRPDEIYHLASPSSVARSFQEPVETTSSIVNGTVHLLEAIRRVDKNIRFFNAASTEMFGDCEKPADIQTPPDPHSPYGVAKSAAFLQTRNYRDAYGLYACSGVMANFESPLRPVNFVTRKIVSTACRIAAGEDVKLRLGNTSIRRDWGWAEEYVEAAWLMLQQEQPIDFVIATGEHHSLNDFLDFAFQSVAMDYRDHVRVDGSLFRLHEIKLSVGDPRAARERLGWEARLRLPDIVKCMVDAELGRMDWCPWRIGIQAAMGS